MTSNDNEAREFFRVSCPVLVSVRDTGGDKVPATKAADYFPSSEQLNLQRELRQMDHDNAHLLHAISENDRNLSHYLAVINRKIDAVARHLAMLTPPEEMGSEQQVSLSEGGTTFTTRNPLVRNQVVALRITLLPNYLGLSVYARVTRCNESERGNWAVSVEFERLTDPDRQILARHVMQVQMAEHRKRSMRE